jgi:hypothetical protein
MRSGTPIATELAIIAEAAEVSLPPDKLSSEHLSLSRLLRTWVKANESLRSFPRFLIYLSS